MANEIIMLMMIKVTTTIGFIVVLDDFTSTGQLGQHGQGLYKKGSTKTDVYEDGNLVWGNFQQH